MVYDDDKNYWGDYPESFGDEDSDDMMKLIYATMDKPLPPSIRDNFTKEENYIYYELLENIKQLEHRVMELESRLSTVVEKGIEWTREREQRDQNIKDGKIKFEELKGDDFPF